MKGRVEWGRERKRQGLKPKEKRVKLGGREDREGRWERMRQTQQWMRKRGSPAPLMSNLEDGVEGSSLVPSQFIVPVVTAPHH